MSDQRIALYTKLFEGRRPAIRNFLLKKYGSLLANDIDDVVQDAYLRGRNSFAERTVPVFNSWIILCAISAANMYLRKRKKNLRNASVIAAEPLQDLYMIGSIIGPAEALDLSERGDAARRFVESLPERLGQAVVLLLQGFSYKEIAGQLGITYEALKSRIHRARHGSSESRLARAA